MALQIALCRNIPANTKLCLSVIGFTRQSSCSSPSYPIRLSSDETCIYVEHPDVEHEYRYTKPMPGDTKDNAESILRVDSRHMITKSPNLEQLQTLTYTPYRYWKQYPGREKRQRYRNYFNDNVDRPGLTS